MPNLPQFGSQPAFQEAGIPAVVGLSGVVSDEGAATDRMGSSIEVAVCESTINIIFPHPPQPVTEEEFQNAYDNQLEVASCLDAEGYPGEIPSFSAFFDGSGNWTAYDVIGTPPEEWDRIDVGCPQ